MKKNFLLIIWCMLLTSIPVLAQSVVTVDGVVYSIENTDADGHAIALKAMDEIVNLVIPTEIESDGIYYPVISIGNEAFKDMVSLKTVQIGNGIQSIGDSAFYNCNGLETVNIPGSVKTLGIYAFSNCTNLQDVVIEDGASLLNGTLVDEYETTSKPFIGSKIDRLRLNRLTRNIDWKSAGVKNLEIGEVYTSIPDEMFSYVKTLKSVIVNGESLESIGREAFVWCDSLTYINLPESLKEVKSRAFQMCKSLNISIPSSIETIGEYAFSDCNFQNNLQLDRKTIKSIGEYAFNCCKVDTVIFSGGWKSIPKGLFSGSTVAYADLGEDVVRIDEYAFSGCDKLRFDFPETLGSIGNFALFDCTSFLPLSIPESIDYIGLGNFRVKEMIIEDSEKPLNVRVGVQKIVYPYSGPSPRAYWVTCDHEGYPAVEKIYIGRQLVFECDGGESCKHGAGSPFQGCSDLHEVTLASCDSIPTKTFYDCDGLTKVTILSNGNHYSVCNDAFGNCSRLSSIEFPEGMDYIGATVFNDGALKEVTLHDVIPPTGVMNSFSDKIYSNATLNVPAESVELYSTSMPWILFKKIVGVDFAAIEEVGTDGCETDGPVEYFDLTGVKVSGENLTKGFYLRRQGTKVSKVKVD